MSKTAVEAQVDAFIARYSVEVGFDLRAARAVLRSCFPRGFELVYDNYNALVFGFSPTERASESILSVAGYPRWVTLFFLRGVELEDPAGLLQGSGRQVRSIRLASARQLDEPAIAALVRQSMEPFRAKLLQAKPLQTIIKSVSARQRPRTAAEQRSRRGNAG
jgi:hypothetical protein